MTVGLTRLFFNYSMNPDCSNFCLQYILESSMKFLFSLFAQKNRYRLSSLLLSNSSEANSFNIFEAVGGLTFMSLAYSRTEYLLMQSSKNSPRLFNIFNICLIILTHVY